MSRRGSDTDGEQRIAESAAEYWVSAGSRRSRGLPDWLRRVPGFRRGSRWRMIVASLAYASVLAMGLRGGRAGLIFVGCVALGVAAVTDVDGIRARLPLLRSRHRSRRIAGWLVLATVTGMSFVASRPAPDADRRTSPERPPPRSSLAEVGRDEAPAGAGAGASRTPAGWAATPSHAPPSPRAPVALSARGTPSAQGSVAGVPPPIADTPAAGAAGGLAPPADALSGPYPVVGVVDGDTLKIGIGDRTETIRLIGIDTPETRDPRTPVECFGREAANRARALMEGQSIRIATDPTQDERDRYHRLLAYVWLLDGTFVNYALVAEGYANEYTYDLPYRYQAEFKAAERRARESGAGLWSPDTCNGGGSLSADVEPAGRALGAVGDPTPPAGANPGAAPPAAGAPAPGGGGVTIADVYFNGQVPQVESDEYAVIANTGSVSVNLRDWRLNAGEPDQNYHFSDFELHPGQTCRVYTNERHPDDCGGSFASARAIWNNKGDCGALFDATGMEVARHCY